jgi:tetratricopeptide (TPR) repeat protein
MININSNKQTLIQAYRNKGVLLFKLGRFPQALHCYDKALDIDPLDFDVILHKALALNELGQPEKGVELLDIVIEELEAELEKEKIYQNELILKSKRLP